MATPPVTRNAVVKCITECGPISTRQIAEHLERKVCIVVRPLVFLKQNKLIYIAKWGMLDNGYKEMFVPMYKMGGGKDAERPKPNRKRAQKKYRTKFRALKLLQDRARRANSINVWTSISIGL
jgi:hypothetical protein